MKKLLGLIFLLLFIIFSVLFLLVLNLKLGLYSPEKIKSVAREGGVYELASGIIREDLVKTTETIDSGPFLEIITEAVSTENLANFGEKTIDNLFAALRDPKSHQQLTIPTSQLGDKIKSVAAEKFDLNSADVSLGALSDTSLEILEKDQ
ncbi:MAG: hypothetical protein PHG51_07805, partial [Candidatus Omnitrophica bacterium]|nr:hypothetical protein [Candidatus Omnitrophota bacterium]